MRICINVFQENMPYTYVKYEPLIIIDGAKWYFCGKNEPFSLEYFHDGKWDIPIPLIKKAGKLKDHKLATLMFGVKLWKTVFT